MVKTQVAGIASIINCQNTEKYPEKLEEWKKQQFWKKKNIYFLSFSTKYWKNGRSQAKKFTRPIKNPEHVGRMEESVEKENNLKLKKIFSFIFHKILEEWKKLGKKFTRPGKNSENVGRMEEAVK